MPHNELASSLAAHLLSDNRMVWEDIPAGRAGSIRPDVLTIEKSFAKPKPISYEIKVSVADFRADITSGKWKGYLQFSDGVVFAVPKGLITKKDIPNGCGLMTFNGQFWNTVKRPTLQNSTLDNELLLKLLIGGKDRQTTSTSIKQRTFDERMHEAALMKKFGDDFRRKIHFINTYDRDKQELTNLKQELLNILELDNDPNAWNTIHDIKSEIKLLRESTDRQLIYASVLKDLNTLNDNLSRSFERVVHKYEKGENNAS